MSPFNLPPGWAFVRMAELGRWCGGGTPSKSNLAYWKNGTIPWVSPKDMKVPVISDAEDHITGDAVSGSATNLVPKDSILVVTRSGILERTLPSAISAREVAINQDLKALVPSAAADPKFLALALRGYERQILHTCRKSGTTVASIEFDRLLNFQLALPPLNEQRRIVGKLEALLTRSRRTKEALDAVPALLERFRQSVLAAAFRGNLTRDWREKHPDVEPASKLLERIRAERRRRWEEAELERMRVKGKALNDDNWKKKYEEPLLKKADSLALEVFGNLSELGWSAAPLDALCDAVRGIPYGIVQTGDEVEGGIPTVRCGDLKAFRIDTSALKRVSPQIERDYVRTRLDGGEVLLAIRGTVGGVAVAGDDMRGMNISREIAMLPTLPGLAPRYLMYMLASPPAAGALAGHTKGVAQQGVNLFDLRSFPVPLPPLAEQHAVAEQLDAHMAKLKSLEAMILDASDRVPGLERAVLAKAFHGELVPQDATDEPSSVLLERMRSERKQADEQEQSTRPKRRRETKVA